MPPLFFFQVAGSHVIPVIGQGGYDLVQVQVFAQDAGGLLQHFIRMVEEGFDQQGPVFRFVYGAVALDKVIRIILTVIRVVIVLQVYAEE